MFNANAFGSFWNFPFWGCSALREVVVKTKLTIIYLLDNVTYICMNTVDYTRVISVVWVNSKILFILFC